MQPLFSEPRKIVDEFAVGEDEDSCSINLYQPWVSVPAPKIAKTAAVGGEPCERVLLGHLQEDNGEHQLGRLRRLGGMPVVCTSWVREVLMSLPPQVRRTSRPALQCSILASSGENTIYIKRNSTHILNPSPLDSWMVFLRMRMLCLLLFARIFPTKR